MQNILVIDDSDEIQILIKAILGREYNIFHAYSGEEAIGLTDSRDFDLILLDLSLPDLEGFDLCNRFRESHRFATVPIIVLSARVGPDVHTEAYKLGANNYLEKPFSKKELVALVDSKLKFLGASAKRVTFANLERDINSMIVRIAGKNIDLAPKEFLVLNFLLSNFDDIVDRKDILESVWCSTEDLSSRVVDNHINLLRRKLREADVIIESVYGKGYRAKLLRGEL